MRQDKGIASKSTAAATPPRRNHLFLIAIAEKYEHWQHLQYPVSDCEKLAALLQRRYGFEAKPVRFLREEEATCEVIYDDLYNLLNNDEAGEPLFSERDNLVLVFSGHGHLDEKLDQGYWTPVDAPVPEKPNDLKKLISVDEVAKILSKVRAQHIVLIVDACFPLKFAHIELDVPPGGAGEPEEMPSRWVLTSGRKEPVPDKSLFSESLLDILENNSESQLSITWLGAQIVHRVGKVQHQRPWCGSLTQNQRDGGEFCFNLKKPAPGYVMELSAFVPPLIFLDEHLRRGSQEYFDRLQKGRFRFLQIQKLLLPHADLPELIHTEVQLGEQTTYLFQALELLQSQEKRHAIVLGEGGMGKTVSLVQLWKVLLDTPNIPLSQYPNIQSPIPIFIALNEFNAVPEHEQEDFLVRYLAKNYFGLHTLTDDWKNAIWQSLTEPLPGGKPRYLLLLDGFNEVTVPKEKLSISLNRLNEQAAGVQMVMTSRFVEIQNFTWAHRSEILRLQPLSPAQIEDYLKEYLPSLPTDKTLLEQLANPMMLTLFAGSSSIARRWQGDGRFRFLPVASFGELLWNFNEAQLANHFEECQDKPGEQAWHLFLLRCLVPYLAWRMEKEGQFFIPTRKSLDPRFNFKTVLDEAFRDLDTEALTEVFPSFEGKRPLLGFGIPDTLDAREQRSLRVRTWLVEKLHCLVPEGDTLRFVHQNFRDFYAAVHLLNEIDLAQHTSDPIPQTWQERTFPIYLRRMLGNIEGEHHFEAKKFAKGVAMPGFQAESRLARLLDGCRGIFHDERVKYAVWNLVMIAADVRGTLAGMNLERLDLRMVYLNGIVLSQHLGGYRYLPARLAGSLFDGKWLFPQGHSAFVSSACYSPDGKRVLSGSHDWTLKEWSVANGECLQTFTEPKVSVTSACYSPDGKKVLSRSSGNTVKEWSVESGECLQTFAGQKSIDMSACYSPDGKKVLSGSSDGTLKEWSVESGECLQTFAGHSDLVRSVCYSPDGKKVLSGSSDGTLKEWSVESGECLQTFAGHSDLVCSVCYSPDGKKVLSGSNDSTLKEWSVQSRECLQTFAGHDGNVSSACYSPDEKKVLSSSGDRTLKEWSVASGECLQTFAGHDGSVSSACYSPDGKKVLSSSGDRTLKEWSVASGECLQTFAGHEDGVSSISYSPDGKKVLSGLDDKTAKEWSVASGECLQTFAGHEDGVSNISYSLDGKKVLSGSYDGTLKEWSVASGECLQTFAGHDGSVRSTCYSLDGKKVLSGSDDGTLKEWSVESGECLQTFAGHENMITSVSYSPDGKKVLSGAWDNTVKEWSVESGKCLQTFVGSKGMVTSVCYSPDGKKVLSFSEYGTVKELSVESGECLSTGKVHWMELERGKKYPGGERGLQYDRNKIEEVETEGQVLHTWVNSPGLYVWHCDLTSLHPDSHITEEEKTLLRMYGAII